MFQKYPLISAVWEQNRILIVIIIVLFILTITIFIGQRWVSEPSLQALRTEQSLLQQHVRERQMAFASNGVPISTAEQIEKNLERFNQLVPAQVDFPNFIGELFNWAQQSGLNIHQISYHPEYEEQTGFLRYGLSFSVKGEYSQIKKFIYLLEHTERILVVEKISLRRSSSNEKTSRDIDLKIELSTYFRRGTA